MARVISIVVSFGSWPILIAVDRLLWLVCFSSILRIAHDLCASFTIAEIELTSIPAILETASVVCVKPLTQIFAGCIENSCYTGELQCSDVTSRR